MDNFLTLLSNVAGFAYTKIASVIGAAFNVVASIVRTFENLGKACSGNEQKEPATFAELGKRLDSFLGNVNKSELNQDEKVFVGKLEAVRNMPLDFSEKSKMERLNAMESFCDYVTTANEKYKNAMDKMYDALSEAMDKKEAEVKETLAEENMETLSLAEENTETLEEDMYGEWQQMNFA